MVESPRQGGSPQARARRQYGGQPIKVDERSCGADFIRAKPIPRPYLFFNIFAKLENIKFFYYIH